MKKVTHKRKALNNVANVIGAAPSVAEAARRLDVDRSTVHRWIKAGHASAPGQRAQKQSIADETPAPLLPAADWIDRMRAIFNFDTAEIEILRLAQAALDVASNSTASASVRLRAMAEFRAAVRHLQLPEEPHAHAQKPRPVVA